MDSVNRDARRCRQRRRGSVLRAQDGGEVSRGEGARVLIGHQGNLGYAPDQIDTSFTLGDLLEAVQEAVEEWGEDAIVVTHQTNNGRGANYGSLYVPALFSPDDED